MRTMSVLERDDAEECKSSEATWLPVAWHWLQPWKPALRSKAISRAIARSPCLEQPAPPPRAEPPLVTQARQYIADHYIENLSLQHVADALGTKACPLGQMFTEAMGIGFGEHLDRVRVEKAKNLLLNPNYYIIEIASALGFASLEHFTQAFTRIVGESPPAYRARLPVSLCCAASALGALENFVQAGAKGG